MSPFYELLVSSMHSSDNRPASPRLNPNGWGEGCFRALSTKTHSPVCCLFSHGTLKASMYVLCYTFWNSEGGVSPLESCFFVREFQHSGLVDEEPSDRALAQ